MSLAEQAFINYSKELLKKIPDDKGINSKVDTNKIEEFIPKLDKVISEHSDWEYPLYFKAKLSFALGKREEIREFILPFAKKKRNEFWVWNLLSDTYPDDDEHKMACLCKALLCEAQVKMTVNVHAKLGKILNAKGFKPEAEIEEALVNLIKGDVKAGEFDPIKLVEYQKRQNGKDNKGFYQKYLPIAEEVLFYDMTLELAIVEFVNKDKKILNFIINKSRSGFFKYDRFINKVEIGDKFLVRLEGSGINTLYKLFTLEKTDQPVSNEILKEFNGKIRKNDNQPFGFIDDIFIEPHLIEKYKLINGSELSGIAIISFNKKKSNWGWKAIKLS